MNAGSGWTCEYCGGPIGTPFEDGCVEISYQPSASGPRVSEPGVRFGVHHSGCEPALETPAVSYVVGCGRVSTPVDWAACVAATAEHGWMTKEDVAAMVGFFFEARGGRLPSGPDAPDPTPRRTD